eukprot:39608-Hanusia_phi.AAC.1
MRQAVERGTMAGQLSGEGYAGPTTLAATGILWQQCRKTFDWYITNLQCGAGKQLAMLSWRLFCNDRRQGSSLAWTTACRAAPNVQFFTIHHAMSFYSTMEQPVYARSHSGARTI